ncbi:MAG: hypothetical protein GY820_10015 [Gammaproteobacteria bacterium]|nr:hypothetical protein [Gammaproteobacteria bacterium]
MCLGEFKIAIDQNTISALTAVASLIGALGGLFAAIAAFRSAGTAKASAAQALAVEKRSQVRDLSNLSNSVLAETMRVDDIANKLKTAYQTLAVFAGASGGSRIKLHTDAVETKQREIGPIQDRAREYAENWQQNRKLGEEELTTHLAEIEGYLIQVRRVKEKLLQELESVEEQNKTYRDKAINST